MAAKGQFDPTLMRDGWFDPALKPAGWFDEAISNSSTLTTAVTGLSITGSSATLKVFRGLATQPASVAVTGQDVVLMLNRVSTPTTAGLGGWYHLLAEKWRKSFAFGNPKPKAATVTIARVYTASLTAEVEIGGTASSQQMASVSGAAAIIITADSYGWARQIGSVTGTGLALLTPTGSGRFSVDMEKLDEQDLIELWSSKRL